MAGGNHHYYGDTWSNDPQEGWREMAVDSGGWAIREWAGRWSWPWSRRNLPDRIGCSEPGEGGSVLSRKRTKHWR